MAVEALKIPYSKDIEEAIIGGILINEHAAMEALQIVKHSSMFFDSKLQTIFIAIQELYNANQPIDLLTVVQKLGELENPSNVSNYDVIQVSKTVGSAAHIEHHCRILMQFWIKRKLIQKANVMLKSAYDDSEDSLELLHKDAVLHDEIQEMISTGAKQITYSEALEQTEKRVEILSSLTDGQITGLPTGYKKIDAFTGGWQPSDLIIVAARPGMGKTSFILKTLVECGKQNFAAGFFSLEMSAQQLAARTVSINSDFHLSQLVRDGFEKPKYFLTLKSKTNEMKKFPVFIDDTPGLDIRDLMAKARIWKRKHDLKIVIVDYLQLAADKSKGNNREQEISSISRNLKKLAKELHVPVVALSQLSRSVETRNDRRPRLSDLRESGAIEQDADIVTFLYRPEYYNLDIPEELAMINANAELSFAKYRQGSLETKGLHWDANKTKYMDPLEENYDQDSDLPKLDPNNPDETPF